MKRALPNHGHHALAALEAAGRTRLLITQNVDGLHEAAGSRRLCALHGRIADVVCLGCRERTSRAALHRRLAELNPGWSDRHADVAVRPDGDVELTETSGFVVPGCEGCGGVLKPDVVFFGENVPKPRVERCYAAMDALDPAAAAARARLVADGDVRLPVRAARHQAPRPGGGRQPRPDARRRPPGPEGRPRHHAVPHRAHPPRSPTELSEGESALAG